MEKQPPSGSEQKIQEYIARIKAGESKDSILQGLPPSFVSGIETGLGQPENLSESLENENPYQQEEIKIPPQYEGLDSETLDFIWTIPEYIDPEKNKREKYRKQKAIDFLKQQELAEKIKSDEDIKLEEIRAGLGIVLKTESQTQQPESSTEAGKEDKRDPDLISDLIKGAIKGKSKAVEDLYKNFLDNIENEGSRTNLVKGLFQASYNKYRVAEYPNDPEEEQIWDKYLQSTKVGVNNKNKEWMYRGKFPKSGEETITRGSFNVKVTPELIDALDEMIASGKIKANYKFGQPGTTASPNERHDSISIYFLEQPSDEILKELSSTIKPYVRGDNLLGKKIDEGFFMSEIGSIESEDIDNFIVNLKQKDPALSEAVRIYTSPQTGRGHSQKMSEAQFYAIKDVLKAFGCEISYNKQKGFEIQ